MNLKKIKEKLKVGLVLKGIAVVGLVIYFSQNPVPTNIVIGFIVLYFLIGWTEERINKKIDKKSDQLTTQNSVVQFSVNPYNAIVTNKRFGEIVGLKTNTQKEWSKADYAKFNKKGGIGEKLRSKLHGVDISYFKNDDAYYVKDYTNYSRIVPRKFVKTSLYSEPVTGNIEGPRLDLEIYERIPNFYERRPMPYEVNELKFLSVCLKYYSKGVGDTRNEDEFTILCELPLFYFVDRELLGDERWEEQFKKIDDYVKNAGFEESSDSFPDMPMKDDFGEENERFSSTKYIKNGVVITFYD